MQPRHLINEAHFRRDPDDRRSRRSNSRGEFDRIFGLATKFRAEAERLHDSGLFQHDARRSDAANWLHDFFGDNLPDDITAPKCAVTEGWE